MKRIPVDVGDDVSVQVKSDIGDEIHVHGYDEKKDINAIAHYFSLLVFEGQTALSLASDPLNRGWDQFRTAGWEISYSALSPRAISNVQALAIVIGHVAGVVLAHDRAISRYPVKVATRTQYPLLAVMVAYTVGALFILLGG